MGGLLRGLVAAMAVAAGSWVGLHSAPAPTLAPAPAPLPAATAEAVEPDPVVPQNASMPEFVLWPRLNTEASIAKAWRLAQGPHRQPGDRKRLVTLTFDDGPFP